MESLATVLSRHWPLDHVVPGPTLQRHPTRASIAILSDQGPFVVKAYDDAARGLVRPTTTEIDQHLSVFAYLAEKGFGHAPHLLRTRAGERSMRTGGQTIHVLGRIDGDTPPGTPATWAELGRLAARLNSTPAPTTRTRMPFRSRKRSRS